MISIATFLWIIWCGLVGFLGTIVILWLVGKHIYDNWNKPDYWAVPPAAPVDYEAIAREKAAEKEKWRIVALKGGFDGIEMSNGYKRTIAWEAEKVKNPDLQWRSLYERMPLWQRGIARGVIERQKANGVYTDEIEKLP